jgi:hypothetical protein
VVQQQGSLLGTSQLTSGTVNGQPVR